MTIPHSQPIIDWFFEEDGAENLGAAAGLGPDISRRVLATGLPLQLRALAEYSKTPLGHTQIAEAVDIIPHFPNVNTALSAGEGAADLERAGDSMAPTLLREHREQIAESVANQTGANRAQLRRLFDMTLPLILSRLSWRDAQALAFLPLVGKIAPAPPLIPTNAAIPARSVTRVTRTAAATASEEKRGGFPIWLLPLLLLLLLGGCFLLRPKTVDAPPTTATTASGFSINTPAAGASVSTNGFKAAGTGRAGDEVSIYRDGQSIGTFSVDKDGTWKTDVFDATAPVGNVAYQFRNADGGILGTLPLAVTGAAAAVPVTITEPKAGAEVSAGGFSVGGLGRPGDRYQVYEDGVSIGNATVAPDGTWSVAVAGPAAGNRTYTVLDANGNRMGLVPVLVVSGSAGAACTDAPTISLADNETVSAPFRFGGRGSAESYTVTVWRGDRHVGSKTMKLSADCTWSYQSNPGGKVGQQDQIRYELRPTGEAISTPAAQVINLKVSGSGTNFNSKGEYVGPAK